MNLAVLLYQHVTDKPTGIPDGWPAEVIELGDSTEVPDETWNLMTSEQLVAYKIANQAAYNAWLHPPTLPQIVGGSIDKASVFGANVIRGVAVTNVLTGITQAGKTRDFTLFCQKMVLFLETGSLYAALQELDILIADTSDLKASLSPFLTNDSLNGIKSQIQVYLGL